jgi:hypothetical protein
MGEPGVVFRHSFPPQPAKTYAAPNAAYARGYGSPDEASRFRQPGDPKNEFIVLDNAEEEQKKTNAELTKFALTNFRNPR